MAFVRRRGNQLAIVRGIRSPETKKVEQEILFTIFSRGEAAATTAPPACTLRSGESLLLASADRVTGRR
jgi:hypothetical protein